MRWWQRAAAAAAAGGVVAAVVVVSAAAQPAPRAVAERPAPAWADADGVTPTSSSRHPAAAPAPAPYCRPDARACVDLRRHLAWLQQRGHVTYGPVHIATGMAGHPTPRGLFRVAWKAPHWVSTEYGIPMPWAVFFAAGGIAFHAGPLDEASHGCVHLAPSAARRFFDALSVGDRVDVR